MCFRQRTHLVGRCQLARESWPFRLITILFNDNAEDKLGWVISDDKYLPGGFCDKCSTGSSHLYASFGETQGHRHKKNLDAHLATIRWLWWAMETWCTGRASWPPRRARCLLTSSRSPPPMGSRHSPSAKNQRWSIPSSSLAYFIPLPETRLFSLGCSKARGWWEQWWLHQSQKGD